MSLVLPIYANIVQFSEILKCKAICSQFYIIKYLEYNAICAIIQDWINPANIIAFYSIHSKLTNIICIYYKLPCNRSKSEERAKSIRSVGLAIPRNHICIPHREKIQLVKIFNKGYIYLRPVPRHLHSYGFSMDLKQLFYSINVKRIKENNWKIRKYFAIFSVALVNFYKKNKAKRTNNAGRVFFNRIFNKHIAQSL